MSKAKELIEKYKVNEKDLFKSGIDHFSAGLIDLSGSNEFKTDKKVEKIGRSIQAQFDKLKNIVR